MPVSCWTCSRTPFRTTSRADLASRGRAASSLPGRFRRRSVRSFGHVARNRAGEAVLPPARSLSSDEFPGRVAGTQRVVSGPVDPLDEPVLSDGRAPVEPAPSCALTEELQGRVSRARCRGRRTAKRRSLRSATDAARDECPPRTRRSTVMRASIWAALRARSVGSLRRTARRGSGEGPDTVSFRAARLRRKRRGGDRWPTPRKRPSGGVFLRRSKTRPVARSRSLSLDVVRRRLYPTILSESLNTKSRVPPCWVALGGV